MAEHAVIVWFDYGLENVVPLQKLCSELDSAIEAAGTGEFDGHEIAVDMSDGSLYMYGPDADVLYGSVISILQTVEFLRGARVVRRYGDVSDQSAIEQTTII